jgi:hypothetical protein
MRCPEKFGGAGRCADPLERATFAGNHGFAAHPAAAHLMHRRGVRPEPPLKPVAETGFIAPYFKRPRPRLSSSFPIPPLQWTGQSNSQSCEPRMRPILRANEHLRRHVPRCRPDENCKRSKISLGSVDSQAETRGLGLRLGPAKQNAPDSLSHGTSVDQPSPKCCSRESLDQGDRQRYGSTVLSPVHEQAEPSRQTVSPTTAEHLLFRVIRTGCHGGATVRVEYLFGFELVASMTVAPSSTTTTSQRFSGCKRSAVE